MVTKIAKASTIHRKRLQTATIATMDFAMRSEAIGFTNDEEVFVCFAMLCYLGYLLAPVACHRDKMAVEPLARQPRHFVECSRLFEEVCCSRYDHNFRSAAARALPGLAE
jgi:hypothetical protein